jgi:ATP-binding protein involved in chromosome partitioning
VSVQLELGYAAGLFKAGRRCCKWPSKASTAFGQGRHRCVIAPHKAQAQIPAWPTSRTWSPWPPARAAWASPPRRPTWPWRLAREGARVGILDADIYGPSQGVMFGIAEGTRPQVKDQKWFVPIRPWRGSDVHGVPDR